VSHAYIESQVVFKNDFLKEVLIMLEQDKPKPNSSRNVSEALYLLEAVYRFKRDMEQVPGPNEGRIQELKESIKNKTLVTEDMVDEVAGKMSQIFYKE